MGLLIALIILLVVAVVFFISYPILKRKFVAKKYNVLIDKKVRAISTKNNLKFLSNIRLNFYNREKGKIDHIIFGKKYIYILANFYFDGDIKGTIDNNSWILEKRGDNGCEYIDNISYDLSEKNRVFSSKINANPELIVPIAIVNNECEIKVNGINNNNTFVVHYSSLKKLIKKLESRNLPDLDQNQLQNEYENLSNENKEN